jgi:hypothetical protein
MAIRDAGGRPNASAGRIARGLGPNYQRIAHGRSLPRSRELTDSPNLTRSPSHSTPVPQRIAVFVTMGDRI